MAPEATTIKQTIAVHVAATERVGAFVYMVLIDVCNLLVDAASKHGITADLVEDPTPLNNPQQARAAGNAVLALGEQERLDICDVDV